MSTEPRVGVDAGLLLCEGRKMRLEDWTPLSSGSVPSLSESTELSEERVLSDMTLRSLFNEVA